MVKSAFDIYTWKKFAKWGVKLHVQQSVKCRLEEDRVTFSVQFTWPIPCWASWLKLVQSSLSGVGVKFRCHLQPLFLCCSVKSQHFTSNSNNFMFMNQRRTKKNGFTETIFCILSRSLKLTPVLTCCPLTVTGKVTKSPDTEGQPEPCLLQPCVDMRSTIVTWVC